MEDPTLSIYRVVKVDMFLIDRFEESVNYLISRGYWPLGQMVITKEGWMVQSMILKEHL